MLPLFANIGRNIAAATGSEVVGTTVAGMMQAEALNYAKNKVSEAISEPIDIVKNHVRENFGTYLKYRPGQADFIGSSPPPVSELNRLNIPPVIEYMDRPTTKTPNEIIQESLQDSLSMYTGTQPGDSLMKKPSPNNIYTESIAKEFDQIPLEIRNIEDSNDRKQKILSEVLNVGPSNTPENTLVLQLATDLGNLTCEMCRLQFEEGQTMTDSLTNAAINTSTEYLEPYLLEFHKRVTKLISRKNLGELYSQIANVYHGKNITLTDNLRQSIETSTGLKIYLISDEVGNYFTHRESTSRFYLPNFDEYGGPFSRNKDAPTTLSGLFYMLHDIDYTNRGYFDLESDLKLISRLDNNINRFESNSEVAFANLAIQYFSTIGFTLASFKGRLFKTEEQEPDQEILFHFLQESGLVPKTIDHSQIETIFNNHIAKTVHERMQNTAVYNPSLRNRFIQNKLRNDVLNSLDVYL